LIIKEASTACMAEVLSDDPVITAARAEGFAVLP
jgi:hypothetical protein